MNPSANNSGMELPPVIEQLPPSAPSSQTEKNPEKTTGQTAESQPKASAPATSLPPAIVNVPQTQVATDDSSKDDSASNDNHMSASALQFAQDKDLIDREWVDKAKSIVERNKDDPYKQSEELTLLKADYMKKRFNKTLKLNK